MAGTNGFAAQAWRARERQMVQAFTAGGVQAVLVATHTCPNCSAAKKMLEKAGIAYSVLYADEAEGAAFAERMGIIQAPTLLLPADGGYHKYTNIAEIAGLVKNQQAVTA